MTAKIEKAIRVAAESHRNQKRKGDGVTPYIVHPVLVAILISRYTKDEDIISAALLHDVLEDTDFGHSRLKRFFGKRIYRIVCEITDKRPKASWYRRKEDYLRHIKQASKEACLIACADKINNLDSSIDAYKKFGDVIWKRFNAPKEEKIAFYESVYKEVRKRFRHPLIDELDKAVRRTKRLLKIK